MVTMRKKKREKEEIEWKQENRFLAKFFHTHSHPSLPPPFTPFLPDFPDFPEFKLGRARLDSNCISRTTYLYSVDSTVISTPNPPAPFRSSIY